jgi:hypothetical protein
MLFSALTTLLAAATMHAYAATAQGAAIGAMHADPKKPVLVKRINVVGAYAAVLTSGGRMEGDPVTFAILVERFSFGWQALDALNFHCNLEAHRLGRLTDDALIEGMPKPKDDRPCKVALLRDAGPRDDIETVRQIMRGPLIPYVVVSGDWAMGEWYGGGGGAMGTHEMRKFGVPQSDWCKFGIYDAKCP